MANKTIIGKVQVRIDSAENWSQHNPVLLLNEIVGETQTDGSLRFKRGDGVNAYNLLGYISLAEPTHNGDPATKEFVENEITSASVELLGSVIRKDGTTNLSAKIPFAAGLKTSGIENTTSGEKIIVKDGFDMGTYGITGLAEPTQDSDAVTKSYVDSAIQQAMAGSTAGGVKLLEVALPSGSWTAYGDSGMAWQQTVSNAAITAGTYISIDADVDEIVAHLTDTPITNLTVGTPTAGSAVVYAISEAQPTSDYNVRLVIHEVSE